MYTIPEKYVDNLIRTLARDKRPPIRLINPEHKSWSYEGNGMKLGKQPFMASAVEEFETIGNVEISRNSTLLVDDDPQNIKLALKDGVRAILFLPHKSHNFFKDVERVR